jgi:hypothetical protein
VTRSGQARVPISTPLAGFIGIGIGIGGGSANLVRANRVRGSRRYGIAVFPTARRISFTTPVAHDPGPPFRPSGNVVTRNAVSGSGLADLVVANGVRPGNCFRANVASRTAPPGLQGCGRAGDAVAAAALTVGARKLFDEALRVRRPPEYDELPKPPLQPGMP